MSDPTPLSFDELLSALEQHDREPAQVRLAFVCDSGEEVYLMPFGETSGLLRVLKQDEIGENITDLPPDITRECLFRVGKTTLGFSKVHFVQGALEPSGVLSLQAGSIVLSFNFDIADFRERGSHVV
jgi:hypothetical protein